MTARRYFELVEARLELAWEKNSSAIVHAARVLTDTIAADGIIRTFGTGHSQILALELFDRAGGLAPVDAIIDPSGGRAENVPGYASALLHVDQVRPPDCLVVASTSGRTVAGVELALLARDRGVPVIAVTSLEFSGAVAPRHPSGKRLPEIADVVLDTCAAIGDAEIDVDGVPMALGPTSTVVGTALLEAVVVETAAELARRGLDVPVFASQNVDGTDDHNSALNDRYRGRVRGLI